jgi:hypothetical protein
MKKFKVGDAVIVKHLENLNSEDNNWALPDELKIGRIYIVAKVHAKSGCILLAGKQYYQRPERFALFAQDASPRVGDVMQWNHIESIEDEDAVAWAEADGYKSGDVCVVRKVEESNSFWALLFEDGNYWHRSCDLTKIAEEDVVEEKPTIIEVDCAQKMVSATVQALLFDLGFTWHRTNDNDVHLESAHEILCVNPDTKTITWKDSYNYNKFFK